MAAVSGYGNTQSQMHLNGEKLVRMAEDLPRLSAGIYHFHEVHFLAGAVYMDGRHTFTTCPGRKCPQGLEPNQLTKCAYSCISTKGPRN